MTWTRLELDMKTLPLTEAAVALRSLAQAKLQRILHDAPAPAAENGSVNHVTELIHLLEIDARLKEQSVAAIDTWYRRAVVTLSRKLDNEQSTDSGQEEQLDDDRADANDQSTGAASDAEGSDASNAEEGPDEALPAEPEWRLKLEKPTQTGLMIEVARLQRQALQESRAKEATPTVSDLPGSAASFSSPESAQPKKTRAALILARLVRLLRRLVGFLRRGKWQRQGPALPASGLYGPLPSREEGPQLILPEHVWDYVVTLALDDPRFNLECSKALRSALRERFVMTPGGEKLPEIHVNTHWALQLLVPTEHVDAELARHDLSRLNDEAGRRVESPGWAGFWDQWLIHRAFSRLDEKTPSTESLDRLRELPWVATDGVPADDYRDDSKLALKGWKNQRPTWLDPRNCL